MKEHRWQQPFGFSQVVVSGVVKTIPAVCVDCLLETTSPLADEECDDLVNRLAARKTQYTDSIHGRAK